MGASLSIDETSLSRGELYTIISNKSARGRKGTIVAIVKGTKINDVVKVVKTLPFETRLLVKEVTMDFSDSMHAIVEKCFPDAIITLDRFHVQQLCNEAMQETRLQIKREARKMEIENREQHKMKLHRRMVSRKKIRLVTVAGNLIARMKPINPNTLKMETPYVNWLHAADTFL